MKFEPIDAHVHKLAIQAGSEVEAIADILSGIDAGMDEDPMSIAGISISNEGERQLVLVSANDPYADVKQLPISAILALSRILRSLPSKISDEEAA